MDTLNWSVVVITIKLMFVTCSDSETIDLNVFQFQTQLIHSDDSQSETIIEVNLRHPGKHDRNIVSILGSQL